MSTSLHVPVFNGDASVSVKHTVPCIAVDVDEVLAQFLSQLILFHNDTYNSTLKLSDFFSYHFADVWGGSNEESNAKVAAFLQSSYFEDLPVVPGAYEVLSKYVGRCRFVVVTSRQLFLKDATEAWLAKHFPDVFSEVHFGNHYGTEGRKISKGEICTSLGAIALIDDSAVYAAECSKLLPNVFLFDLNSQYGWSKMKSEVPANVSVCQSWAMVDEQLNNVLSDRLSA